MFSEIELTGNICVYHKRIGYVVYNLLKTRRREAYDKNEMKDLVPFIYTYTYILFFLEALFSPRTKNEVAKSEWSSQGSSRLRCISTRIRYRQHFSWTNECLYKYYVTRMEYI